MGRGYPHPQFCPAVPKKRKERTLSEWDANETTQALFIDRLIQALPTAVQTELNNVVSLTQSPGLSAWHMLFTTQQHTCRIGITLNVMPQTYSLSVDMGVVSLTLGERGQRVLQTSLLTHPYKAGVGTVVMQHIGCATVLCCHV